MNVERKDWSAEAQSLVLLLTSGCNEDSIKLVRLSLEKAEIAGNIAAIETMRKEIAA